MPKFPGHIHLFAGIAVVIPLCGPAFVAGVNAEARVRWDAQFSSFSAREDTKDWIDYCRAFGKNLGLRLNY